MSRHGGKQVNVVKNDQARTASALVRLEGAVRSLQRQDG
ncbi:BQ5605_C039g11799 [Microbotryum silenes-dioicae]|uniref:BQ5605_C039g11799 protein n=1 Tax=Microbotryum silenes-dioicae TaxID=796604 RepID=A0A2X0P9U4_9BASI|nr:BQ5605_C039g11799 [Microbotryum silenes-dioicae]